MFLWLKRKYYKKKILESMEKLARQKFGGDTLKAFGYIMSELENEDKELYNEIKICVGEYKINSLQQLAKNDDEKQLVETDVKDRLNVDFIESKANEVLALINPPIIFPIDPIKIAKVLGLEVFTATLPHDVSGQIFYKEKKIFIETTDYITRQTFSIAHEIGHFILHNDGTSHTSKRDSTVMTDIDIKELETNNFAENLLMPKDEVLKLVGNRYKLDLMASYFGVSSSVMEHRLNNLGITIYV